MRRLDFDPKTQNWNVVDLLDAKQPLLLSAKSRWIALLPYQVLFDMCRWVTKSSTYEMESHDLTRSQKTALQEVDFESRFPKKTEIANTLVNAKIQFFMQFLASSYA